MNQSDPESRSRNDRYLETPNERQSDHIADLLERCALHDRQALRQLYDASSRFLYSVAFQLLRNESEAQDAVQDAFIQIWQNAAAFDRQRGRPMTWLASIVRYRALDRCAAQQRSRETGYGEEDAILHETACDAEGPQEHLAGSHRRRLLSRCMSELSAPIRRCVELAYLRGYSREDIAQLEAANLNTVKSWLRRGAESLQQCITRLQEQGA